MRGKGAERAGLQLLLLNKRQRCRESGSRGTERMGGKDAERVGGRDAEMVGGRGA